jgi:hypothetical protein
LLPFTSLTDYRLNLIDLDFTAHLNSEERRNAGAEENSYLLDTQNVVGKFKRVLSSATYSSGAVFSHSPRMATSQTLNAPILPLERSELVPRELPIQPISTPIHPNTFAGGNQNINTNTRSSINPQLRQMEDVSTTINVSLPRVMNPMAEERSEPSNENRQNVHSLGHNSSPQLVEIVVQQHNEIKELRSYITKLRRIILDLGGDYPDFHLVEDVKLQKNQEDSVLSQEQLSQLSLINKYNDNNTNDRTDESFLPEQQSLGKEIERIEITDEQIETQLIPKYLNEDERLEIKNYLDFDDPEEVAEKTASRNSVESLSKSLLFGDHKEFSSSVSSSTTSQSKNLSSSNNNNSAKFQNLSGKPQQQQQQQLRPPSVNKPFHTLQHERILMEMPSSIQESQVS